MADSDPPRFDFASKATTLEYLLPCVTKARLCPQIIVPTERWRGRRREIVAEILERFGESRLAVRSSAANEDGWNASQAGAHLTHTDVEPSPARIDEAIDEVFSSYRHPSPEDQVLIQPMVGDVAISGVVLSRDLNSGSPYYVVNYDDVSGRTDTVTGGAVSKTILIHRSTPEALRSTRFRKLIDSIKELERITDSEELDIEFCIDAAEQVFILQVRPLAARHRWTALSDDDVDRALDDIRGFIAERMAAKPGIAGSTTILGEMPDWNPAEMIGNTPHPLALSLYKHLITDSIWARARADMGYRAVEEPLLIDLHGRPFIDVRLSFNSFLPAGIDEGLAHRLVDHYLERLAGQPELHDKIEFEIALTCRDFDFASQRRRLSEAGFSDDELSAFEKALSALTHSALRTHDGELERLVGLADSLLEGNRQVAESAPLEEIRRLLDDCMALGTLPFSILARHAFIGVRFLKSLVARGVFGDRDADRFMRSIHTVAADFVADMGEVDTGAMDRDVFLRRYGHLRPGTYDILSWRYDEQPDLFLGRAMGDIPAAEEPFAPTPGQLAEIGRLLDEAGYTIAPAELFEYIVTAIEAREQAKFAFSRSISDALVLITRWGERLGLSREDLSFLSIGSILEDRDPDYLRDRVAEQRRTYELTRAIRLPHLICEPTDIYVVRIPLGRPTFITSRSVEAKSLLLSSIEPLDIDGRIVLIESADPGFDWIFSHPIAGLITKYGGANSHMAIRCAEFGLPAAIGCGERLFETLLEASVIQLNCAANKVSGH